MTRDDLLRKLAYHMRHSTGLPHDRACGLYRGWRCSCWQPDLTAAIEREYDGQPDSARTP